MSENYKETPCCPVCGHSEEGCRCPKTSLWDRITSARQAFAAKDRALAAMTERGKKAEAACAEYASLLGDAEATDKFRLAWYARQARVLYNGSRNDAATDMMHVAIITKYLEELTALNRANPGQPILNELAALKAENAELRKCLDPAVVKAARSLESMKQLTAENARLRGIVERLPKTADGVPVAYGDTVWFIPMFNPGPKQYVVKFPCHDGFVQYRCYSTRAAAEAARKAK